MVDAEEINEMLGDALRTGSASVDQAFADALTEYGEDNNLVDHDGSPLTRVGIDGFGERFDLADRLKAPYATPFTEEDIAFLAQGWGWRVR